MTISEPSRLSPVTRRHELTLVAHPMAPGWEAGGRKFLERFPFLWNRKRALDSCICRIFYGEPLHTSPENALASGRAV